MKSYKICHIADVHWRGLSRHEEYKNVFTKIFNEIRNEKVDAIVIAGDIVHTKTQGISPEVIDHLTWWFKSFAKIAPVYVTLGEITEFNGRNFLNSLVITADQEGELPGGQPSISWDLPKPSEDDLLSG